MSNDSGKQHFPTNPLLLARARELRRTATAAEDALWQRLRNRGLAGLKFRRQKPSGASVADFYCDAARVMVELDGITHVGKEQEDAARDAAQARMGILVVRFSNNQVWEHTDEVLGRIETVCLERIRTFGKIGAVRPSKPPHPGPLPAGEGE